MDTSSEELATHPRLYFGPSDLDTLRQKRQADPVAAAAWARTLEAARQGMELPLPKWEPRWEYDKGESGHASMGDVLGQAATAAANLAFVFLLTGEEEYSQRAIDLMISVCNADFWTSPPFYQPPYDPPWRAALDTSHISQWMATAYDWLYGELSVEERDRIRLNISYKGVMPLIQDWADPSTRLQIATHIKPWGNWWANCIAPAGTAALAIFGEEKTVRWETGWAMARPEGNEESLSARWVRLAREAMDWFWRFEGGRVPKLEKPIFWFPVGTFCAPNFDEEGGYAEGVDYLDVLIRTLRFTEAHRRVMGVEILPLDLMRKVSDFVLYTCYAEGGRIRTVGLDDTRANSATNPEITALLANKLRHRGLQWYCHASQPNFEEDSIFRLLESPVFTFLWYDPGLAPEPPHDPVAVKVYPGNGWGVMRSGWGAGDTLFVIKSGSTAGHAHADAGTFLLHHAGRPLVIDSGTSSYIVPEWHTYYHTTRAHSTITVAGQGQKKRLPGRIVGHGASGDCGIIVADAAAPYEGVVRRFCRRAVCFGRRCFVIVDDLAKDRPGPFEWLLHYDGEVSLADGSFLVSNGNSRLLVTMIEPSSFVWGIEKGFRATHEDVIEYQTPEQKRAALERSDYLRVCPAEDQDRQVFFAVLYPFVEGEMPPAVSVVRRAGWIGIEVCRDGLTDLVALRRQGASRSGMHDLESDARFVALTLDGRGDVKGCALDRGTHLRSGGRPVPLQAAWGSVAVGGASRST